MAKFSIVLCIFLVASAAYADDPSEVERRIDPKIKRICADGINNLFIGVLGSYKKVMASSPHKAATDLAEYLYQLADKELQALQEKVMNPDFKMPFGDNSLACSDDIAYKAYDVFYRSWNGLEELATLLGLN